jgi:hypothetical protein
VFITIASKPAQATDGSFLAENVVDSTLLTDAEIQAGRWVDASQLDPGTYWLIVNATPEFTVCLLDDGSIDPSCADGYSNVLQLVVPTPPIHYTAAVQIYRFLGELDLKLLATPLGSSTPYHVCYRLRTGSTRCLSGTLPGYDWSSSADDTEREPVGAGAGNHFQMGCRRETVATRRVRTR